MPTPKLKQYRLEVEQTELPSSGKACSVALAVLTVCKRESWDELRLSLRAGHDDVMKAFAQLVLDDDQYALLTKYEKLIRLLRNSRSERVTVQMCPMCKKWILVGSDRSLSKCATTLGCEGKPIKIKAAKRIEVEPLEKEPAA